MFWRVVRSGLLRQRGKRLMIAFTVALGVSLATAMLNVMFDVGDKVNQELKAYGANITVRPEGAALFGELYEADDTAVTDAYLREDELGNIKTIFWALNIVDFAPYLEQRVSLGDDQVTVVGTWFSQRLKLPTGEEFDTGMRDLKSWWDVEGEWVTDDDTGSAMVGSDLANQRGITVGDRLTLTSGSRSVQLRTKAIFDAGGHEDGQIFIPLQVIQHLTGKAGQVGSVEISALTTPDNELSRRAAKDPQSLSASEWETWYCTAYVSAISYQIEEVLTGSVAKPVRQVAEAEGAVLEKTRLLMLAITGLSLIGTALAISNLVTVSVMERAPEIGLLKALGARDLSVLLLMLTEIFAVSIGGGTVGFLVGLVFAQVIGHSIFASAIGVAPMVIPLVAVLVALVILLGSLPAMRVLLSLRPAEVLHGR
ncbi:ABC transporter permease [Nonomuraea basaltis]|uniref:ABC transporter permease n=1 Tax=Nonomuraea basaltis TaxID=2495887 RepID=UPI00110C4CB2|nr:ABC transporter permease [Nonomuraea basaltis]TMR96828.1 ABC transporter permease [Nonomuraea basaltis]